MLIVVVLGFAGDFDDWGSGGGGYSGGGCGCCVRGVCSCAGTGHGSLGIMLW